MKLSGITDYQKEVKLAHDTLQQSVFSRHKNAIRSSMIALTTTDYHIGQFVLLMNVTAIENCPDPGIVTDKESRQ